jgi:TrmH family RNA methyltransferase
MPLEAALAQAPGAPVMGAVLGGENMFRAALPPNGLVVIGNEGRGISPAAEARLTHRLTIPRHPDGGAESLNAAVAAGIFAAAIRNPQSAFSPTFAP